MTSDPLIARLYPTARIRGRRITRLPEKFLHWVVLDAATAEDLGREHVGWFVGSHPGLACATEQLGRLDTNPEGGVWVVVPFDSCGLFDKWPYTDHVPERPKRKNNFAWRSRKVWVAAPEDLKHLLPRARSRAPRIAGVILLDPQCEMYKDRRQHVVNFRADLAVKGWQPPLLLLTKKPAQSVNTKFVASAFCLNVFQFIAGDSFGCWDAPIEEEMDKAQV